MRSLLPAFLLALTLLASGCAPVYIPNTVNTPMLRQQGEVQVSGYATTSGFDAQAAVALTDHVGVLGAYSYGDHSWENCEGSDCTDVPRDYRRHRFAELGVGYIQRPSDDFGIEFYGGYGRGWAEAFDYYEFFGSSRVVAEGRYQRFYVQPGVYVDRDWLQVGVASRISAVHFYEFESSEEYWSEGAVNVFWEPAVTARAGPDPFVFTLQGGLAIPVGPGESVYDFQPLTISAGVALRLDQLFR